MHPMRSNLLVWGQKNKFGTACSKSHFFKRNDPIFLTWNEPIEKKNYGEAIFLRIKAHCSARSGCKSWTQLFSEIQLPNQLYSEVCFIYPCIHGEIVFFQILHFSFVFCALHWLPLNCIFLFQSGHSVLKRKILNKPFNSLWIRK